MLTHQFNKISDVVENFVPNNIGKLNLWTKSNIIDIDNLDEERVFFDEMKIEYAVEEYIEFYNNHSYQKK